MLIDRLHFEYEREIQALHHHLYGNANLRTPEAIASEVLKIIKALMYAESATGGFHPLSGLTGTREDLLRKGATLETEQAAQQAQDAFSRMNKELRAYTEDTAIELDDSSIFAVLVYLGGFDFGSAHRDWLGDAIEIFRSITAKRLGGQFFTHPLVTELAVKLLDYRPLDGDTLADICAGSGGFLLAGSHAIAAAEHEQGEFTPAPLKESTPDQLIGLEADPQLVQLSNANLAMQSGRDNQFVLTADSLAYPNQWPDEIRRRVVPGTHQCLASNPPFGTKITVKDHDVLRQFELGHRWSKGPDGWSKLRSPLTARAPDILFIERNLQLAVPGSGRVALVTPYQILSGPQAGFVREWLFRHARVRAVIDLPPMTFQPHTGTKASLLVYERRETPLETSAECEDYPIFMAVAEHIGHDRRGKPVFDGDSSDVIKTDIYDVGRAYDAFRSGSDPTAEFEGAFTVSSSDVLREKDLRLNAAFRRPSTGRLREQIISLGTKPGWKVTTIDEIAERIFVPSRFKRRYVSEEDGVPFLSGTGISQVVPTNAKYLGIDDEHSHSCVVRSGWILITRSGSTGIVSSVPASWDGWAVSDHVIRIVPDEQKLLSGYVHAYLRSRTGQDLLRAGIFGSVIDEITPEHVGSIPIPVPSSQEQIDQVAREMDRADQGRALASEGIASAIRTVEGALT